MRTLKPEYVRRPHTPPVACSFPIASGWIARPTQLALGAVQPAPYNAWEAEVESLTQLFGHLGSSHAYTLGQPSAGCLQWHLFVAQAQAAPAQLATPQGCSIEICSTGLCPRQALSFHRADSNFVSAAQTTAKTGIKSMLPNADIDDYLFEPCGYSMNGLEDDGVASTIHITPEDHCSYASLEISGPKQAGSIAAFGDDPSLVIRGAASIFRPRHMAVAVSWSGDSNASCGSLRSPSGNAACSADASVLRVLSRCNQML